MGVVEVALRREGAFHRTYAVKRPYPHLARDPGFRAMFMDEARLAGLVRHPNVVSVLDVGEDEAGPFLVMEYVPGLSVAALVEALSAAGERLPLPVALLVALHAARGLHAAHELAGPDGAPLGLVHRDVSPQNLLVGFDGLARLTDFGIAKALGNTTRTTTGVLKGNVGYMAPEYLRFEPVDRRADLFSLGVVLYEMLTGARLYGGADAHETARRVLHDPPPDVGERRADAPAELVALLLDLLAKSRADRPPDARAVAARIEAVLAELALDEAAIGLAAYMEGRFAARRAQAEAEHAAALRQALATRRRVARRWPRIAIGGVAAAAVGALGLALTRGGGSRAGGLHAEYFRDEELGRLAFVRRDPQVLFDWALGSPDPRLPNDGFSVRWTGRVRAPRSGVATFCLRSDDGVRLWIDGALVVADWNIHAPTETCGQASLVAGRDHAVRLEYFERNSNAVVQLFWQPPGSPVRVPIPPSHLTPP
jgi:serine/threonine-protein kinase